MSMRCMLPGYGFEPRPNIPNRRVLAAICREFYLLWNISIMLSRISSRITAGAWLRADLAAILIFHGTAGSIITIGFITKRMLALEKPGWREKTRLTSPEVRAAAASRS